jgi:molybdopterin converting factor subunit 1
VLVTVRLFARLRELAGNAEIKVELPEGSTAGDAWTLLTTRHPGLDAYSSSISCAVNEEYARMRAPLRDGDEVAFLPPVSGGGGQVPEVLCSTS